MVCRRTARLGRDPPRALFRFQNSRHQRQVILCVGGCAHRLSGQLHGTVRKTRLGFEEWMHPDTDTEMHHFIGKDIIYFHCLFWPPMLEGAGMRRPTGVHAHGFLTVNGTKMSKSRGTFIMARTWLDHLHPDYLRYYFAGKLGSGLSDIDLNLEDFRYRVNADPVGIPVNIHSRSH